MSAPPKLPSGLPQPELFKQKLRGRHLEQLREVEIQHETFPGAPWPTLPGTPSPYEQLVEWSNTAHAQIAKAVASQAISPDTVDWNIQIFALLESAAVYLRDTEKVVQAALEARNRTDEADKRALQLLEDSQADIKRIAALWGCDFEVICDLLKYSPDGQPSLNGPFCGVFWSTDTNKPFLGLAFKGTNMKDWKEILVDLKFAMMKAIGGILWGSSLHSGFYQTMFLKFPNIQSAPLDYMKNMVDSFLQTTYLVPDDIQVYLHCTGHSLGGAYATLCYAELLRLYNNTPTVPGLESVSEENDEHSELLHFFSQLKKERKFILRDLYTFGCPRLGGVDQSISWAQNYKTALNHHTGQSWRIVNKYDPVTKVPPVIPLISTWNHVDNGYEISDESSPQPLPSEIDTQPGVDIRLWNASYHQVPGYFQNLYNASSPSDKIRLDYVGDVKVPSNADEIAATLIED